jgi:hypothetical protein
MGEDFQEVGDVPAALNFRTRIISSYADGEPHKQDFPECKVAVVTAGTRGMRL